MGRGENHKNPAETATVISWTSMPIFPLRTSGVAAPHPQVRAQQPNVPAHDASFTLLPLQQRFREKQQKYRSIFINL